MRVTKGTRVFLLALLLLGSPAAAQPAGAQGPVTPEPPQKVRELLTLLDDPAVRDWLSNIGHASRPESAPPVAQAGEISAYLSSRLAAIRQHFASLAATLPTMPDEFRQAGGALLQELQQVGVIGALLLLLAFIASGASFELLFRKATAGADRYLDELDLATVEDRLRALAIRFVLGLGRVVAFALGSIGAFLVFDWSPLFRDIVLLYLLAVLALRVALVLGRFLFSPDAERFRIVPMETSTAWFWHKRLTIFIGWFAFGWATVLLLDALGFSVSARRIVAYMLGVGLLVIALEAVWRWPSLTDAELRQGSRTVRNAILSVCLLLLWVLWVASAMPSFWLLLFALLLPVAIGATKRAVNHILQPPGITVSISQAPSLLAVGIERGARAALVILAAVLLARAWDIDLVALTAQDTVLTRLVRGALSAVVIALLADLAWQLFKVAIDGKLAEAQISGRPAAEEMRRRARLRTLLPIARNIGFIVLVAIAAMMALAALGVEIGPLIAGAGILGVAVGFGAQTLVRDIISGVFYLLDDAFRVGEYIQSGNYKGTVESFSLRSIKLRHHRGPLYTVPFGRLGAVQNMSRDWVIDKLSINVSYDTDLDKSKKLIKQIGKELAEDPEFAPHIIEPMKMQGVEQFGEYAIQIRMKMMTKPGEQFVIRRRAYAMIKKAFDENGIRFALPTVQVAGESETPSAAAAQRGLELVQPGNRQQVE